MSAQAPPTTPTRRKLTVGQPVLGELRGGEADVFAVDAVSDQLVHVVVRQKGTDVLLSLADPHGKTLVTAEMPGDPSGQLPAYQIVPEPGVYTVRVAKAEQSAEAVRYEIELVGLGNPTENDRKRIEAQNKLYSAAAKERGGNHESRLTAIQLYGEAAPLWEALGEAEYEAGFCQFRIGHLYSLEGDQPKALEFLQKALAIQRTRSDGAGQVLTLNKMAYVYAVLGESQKRLETLVSVREIRHAAGDRAGEASALYNLALAYYFLDEQQKAIDVFQEALAIRRSVGDRRGEALALNALGNVLRNLGAEQKAIEYYQQALDVARGVDDRSEQADAEMGMGDVYFFQGEKQKSLDAYERSASLKKAAADRPGEALALIGIANVYSDLGGRQKIGDSLGEGGKKKALEYYEQSLAIGRASGDVSVQVFALMGGGVAYSAVGDKKQAMNYLNQALFLFGFARYRPGEGWAKYELARVERDRGNLEKALTLAKDARGIVESLRSKMISPDLRASFLAAVHDCFGLEIDIWMRMHVADASKNYQAEALAASERARARVLLETLGESQAGIREGVDPRLLEQERGVQAQLNAKEAARIQMMGSKATPALLKGMEAEVRALAGQYEDINTKIRATSPRYAALKFPQPLTVREIQKELLDPEDLLVEYALGDQQSFLWVVSPDEIFSVVLPKRAEIEDAARRFHDALVDSAGTGATESGKALSRILLAPAAPILGKKRLIVVADGALQYLPFAALPDPDGYQQPLVVNHEIVNVPSASTVAILRRENANRKLAPKTLAILADPVFSADDSRIGRAHPTVNKPSATEPAKPLDRALSDIGLAGFRLSRLPGTRREAAGIADLAPKSERKQALDFDASRATITSPEMAQYRIVHLATHGLLNTVHPELSGIVLSLVDERGQPQDGFLRLHEIYNLKLSADLVVLSACQTGLGKEIRGEGLVGLTRGFMYAGAPRVLASLWKVDDRATAELMKKLYRAMLGTEALRPVAALRAAQIEIWKTKGWENPYYWAAFTLQGEWR